MLGVGWTEMLVIGIVALIVIGPKDLPVMMGRLGKVVATIRRMGSEFQREINKTTGLDQVTDLRRSITEPLKKTAAEITREFNRPLSGGGVAPSGAIKPAVAGSESVVDEIHQKIGMTPPSAAPKIAAPKAVESPAPAEAIAPVVKPARKPRAPKVASVPAAKPPVKTPAKAAAPKKKRAPKPEA